MEEKEGIMGVEERLAWLTEVIRSDSASTADKLRASDQMNRIQGACVAKGDKGVVERLEELL